MRSTSRASALDLASLLHAAYGATLGALLALGLVLAVIGEPDQPSRTPWGDLIDRPATVAPSYLLPNVAALYAPEPREKTFVFLAWLLGGLGAYGAARYGRGALGSPWTLLVVLVGAIPAVSAVAAVALPGESHVGLALVASAGIVVLAAVPRWVGWPLMLKACALVLAVVYAATAQPAPIVHVRWQSDVSDTRRAQLEREFSLVAPSPREGRVWAYELLDRSPENIRTIVVAPEIEDTNDMDRATFTISPNASPGRNRRWALHAVPWLGRSDVSLPVAALVLLVTLVIRCRRFVRPSANH